MKLAKLLQAVRRAVQRRLKARRHKPLPQRWVLLLHLLLATEAMVAGAHRSPRHAPNHRARGGSPGSSVARARRVSL